MKKLIGLLVVGLTLFTAALSFADSATPPSNILTSFDFSVVGLGLNVSPDYQAVPKGIASRIDVGFDAGSFNAADIIAQLPPDYTVRAELSGPAFQTPLALVTKPGKSFDLPSLAILGKYTLSNIRLVDGGGNTLFGAVPQAVAVESIPDPLVTSVTTRQLTLQEIKDRGVTFDSSNFSAYQFTAGFATQSGQIQLNLPVVIPTSAVVNNPPDTAVSNEPVINLPPVPDVPQAELPQNLTVSPFLMQVEEKEAVSQYSLPPIPGIVVIPGNIGFLHQYFSALALVTNGAPLQSNLSISNVQAKIVLPSGADLTAGTDASPGDDPLRMARHGSVYFPRELPVLNPGPDGKNGTADDVDLLHPAESGQADFTIEGLKEGTHKLDFEITATLNGLPIGPVTLKGKATGAVLVRNPDFSLTFGHPSTIRSGEQYDLFVTVTNTSQVPANLVSVSLDPRAISGAVFVEGETSDKSIETIPAGSAATVKFRLKSQRTGKVTATAFESEQVKGKFVLRTGVGELGIPLSPDSLILPYTADVPPDLLSAAMSLLGQAWSVATAPTGALPASVLPIDKNIVSSRAFDLSEAGLRISLGDTKEKALEDFTFDFFGSDNANRGFDDLRRRSSQGLDLNLALGALFRTEIESAGLMAFQHSFADKVSYRPGHISMVASSAPIRVRLTDPSGRSAGGLSVVENRREIPYGDQIVLSDDGTQRSTLTLVTSLASGAYRLEVAADADASFDLGVVLPDAAGVPQQLRFAGVHLSAGATALVSLQPGTAGEYRLTVVDNGATSSISASSVVPIPLHGPQIVAATQIVPGFGPGGDKHGRNVALLYSQRVTKESAQNLANYRVDANRVTQTSVQPGSRMAFLLLRDGIGPFFDRNIAISGLANAAGLTMESDTRKIRTTATGPAAVVTGAVRTARGEPVPNATIRLYQKVWYPDPYTGIEEERYALFSEKSTGADGRYQFDYVLQNDNPPGPFMLEAVNPATNELGSLTTGVSFHGQRLNLDIFMKARGSVSGTVRNSSGGALAGAKLILTTLNDNRTYSATSDGSGAFSVTGIGVGAFSLKAMHQASLSEGRAMGTLPDDGGSVVQDVVLYQVASVPKGNVSGKVVGPDGITPRSGIIVIVEAPNYRNWMRTGADGSFLFGDVFAGSATITARDDASGELSVVTGIVTSGATSVLNVILKGTGTVTGQVQRGDGKPADGLYVIARVNKIARVLQTDANGAFSFSGLSTGEVGIEVLDPKDFNRTVASGKVTLLSAGETANIYLYVPDKAFASGSITGTVYNRLGAPLANAELRQLSGGLAYYKFSTDAQGKYSIPNLALGTYRIVAMSGKEVANGTATLWYDTQVKTLDLYAAGIGSVTVTTYDNADKVPTGADVTLVSTKPNEVGWLVYESRFPSVAKSDAQTGKVTFTGIYAGSLTASSSNVFRPTPVSVGGNITSNGQLLNLELVLKGNPPQPGQPPVNQMGSISGQVLLPDGTPAGADVNVTANYGGGITVTTDADGKFQFPAFIPSGNQRISAEDPRTTLLWQGYVSVPAGLDVPISIKLLGRGSIAVRALNADGSPEPGTHIVVTGSSYPNDSATGDTDASGTVTFNNLSEGGYAVSASGSFGRGGRGQTSVSSNQTASLDVRLDPSGTVTGRFLKADGTTPIGGGQIRLLHSGKVIAYATSSSDAATLGDYRMEFVPMGDFSVDGFDPITERNGVGGGRLTSDGQSTTADVIVTPRGTVKGSVLNYSGTSPIAGSTINISVRGVASFSYSTVSGADGSFVFAGVPAGTFSVDASDPSNGLRGQVSGTLSYEGETAQAEVHIAPTGSIEGRLLMPDGVTPATSGSVTIAGGTGMQIDPSTGSFHFGNLAAGRSYTLNGSETNTLRYGSAIASITNDGAIVIADIILRGIGGVQGTVFDTDGTTGLAGAVVRLSGAGVSYTDYTDANGGFHFVNVPMGAFSLQASHPQRVTAASASGTVGREAETVSIDMTIGPVASVTGRVLLADGVTPARAGGVSFSGSRGNFTGITDSNGVFVFANIPVPCTFSIYVEDAQGLGIGRAAGSLATNGETKDIGTIILDDKPITVTNVDPSEGSMNVPVNRALKVVFSETADAGTLTSSNIYLMQGVNRVSGTLGIDADRKGVTFTPSAPLSGFTLYTMVVGTGVKDLVGRSLPQSVTASFTTIDNIPPSALSISPSNGTLEVASDAVVRVSFSETVDPNSTSGVKLTQGGVEVATRLDLVQGGTVAVLTPLAPLNNNASYTVTVSGVRDSVGNAMQGSLQGSFNTVDTVIPTVTALTVPAGTDLIKGNSILVTARVADSDVALVDFYVNDVKKATATGAPFILIQTLAAEGALHLKAVAQDRVGNRGLPAILDLTVGADQAPTASFVTAAGSSVNTGAPFAVAVKGNDDLNLKEFVLTATGELSATQTVAASGKNATVSFALNAPTTIGTDGIIHLSLVAKDSGGNPSAAVQQTLQLHDSIAPGIVLSSPGQTVKYKPGETAQVTVGSSDNVGLSSIACTASGAASATQLFAIDPVAKSTSQTFSFAVPGDAAPYASIKVTCAAQDGAGNSASALLALTVADVVAPTVLTATPADNASNVAANASLTLTFSETLDPATVSAASVTMTEDGGGAVAVGVTLSGDRKSIVVKPAAALKAGTGYLVSADSPIADDAGNRLAASYLLHFTTDGSAPQVASVTPAADSANIPLGASITVRFNEPIDAASVTTDLVSLVSPSGPAPGTVSVAADKLSFTFKPLNQLGYLRLYTFTLNAGVQDISGNATTSGLSTSFTTQGPDSDLVGYWPMDGDWKDASGNGHHGTPANGPGFVTDHMVGTQAGNFRGASDYVSVGNLYGNFPNNTFSIESWVKLDDLGNGGRRTIAGGVGGGSDYAIGVTENQFTAYVYNKSTGFYAKSGFTPVVGKWYHVAGTFDGSRLKLYVDGELVDDIAATWVQNNGSVDLWIGQEMCCNNNISGLIDDVGLYKRALAAADVFEHYNAGLTTNRVSPTAPTLEPVASSTTNSQILLRGTKDAGTSIRVNGIQIVAHDANTTWQALYNVALGQNLLDITSRDIAGNASLTTSIAVNRVAANPGDPTLVKPTVAIVSPGQATRYPVGATGKATVTVSNSEPIASLWCNAAGAASEGVLVATGGAGNQLNQELNFVVAADAKPSAVIHLFCVAQGASGGLGSATLDILTQDLVSPQVGILSPSDGAAVATGSPFIVRVQANDESELSEVTLKVSGEFVFEETKVISSEKFFNGNFTLNAPTVISGNGTILLTVTAKDATGNLSTQATRMLQLRDGILPTVTLSSPGQTVKYRPGETATVNINIADNIGASHVVCYAYGAATASQTFDPAPQPGEVLVFNFTVPVDALPFAVMTAICTASDAANNSATATLVLNVADVVPPYVSGASLTENATDIPTNASVVISFSESVAAATIDTASVRLTETGSGAVVPASVILATDRKSVTLKPVALLGRGVGYTLTVFRAVTDDAGNTISAPFQLHFTTDNTGPGVVSITPASESANVSVATTVSVRFAEQIDPTSATNFLVTLTSVTGAVTGTVTISSDGLLLIFKPNKQLDYSVAYTFTLQPGVRDISGNASTSSVSSTFTTDLDPNPIYTNGNPWAQQYKENLAQSGDLTGWTAGPSLPNVKSWGASSFVTRNRVYVFGGNNYSTAVYSAPIDSTGTVGAWITDNPFPVGVRGAQAIVTNARVYVIGGHNDNVSSNVVYSAKINSDGTIGTWMVDHKFATDPVGFEGIELSHVLVTKNRVHLVGGRSGGVLLSSIRSAMINPDGTLGTWSMSASTLPEPIASGQLVTTKNRVYLMAGTGTSGYSSSVYTAPINSDGTLGNWTRANSLPGPLYLPSCAIVNQHVYLLGGASSSGTFATATVYRASINADGILGDWVSGTPLPKTLTAASLIITSSKIYLIGGLSRSTVYYAPFLGGGNDYLTATGTNLPATPSPDPVPPAPIPAGPTTYVNAAPWKQQASFNFAQTGDISGWTAGPALAYPVRDAAVVVTNKRVYLLGGNTGGTSMTSATQYAVINDDGTLSPWAVGTNLPIATSYSYPGAAMLVGQRIFWTSGTQQMFSAPVNADGSIGAWRTENSLFGAYGGSKELITKNKLYLLSDNRVKSAPIFADGSVGTWGYEAAPPVFLQGVDYLATSNRVYGFGGGTISAPIYPDGSLGTWINGANFPQNYIYPRMMITAKTAYSFGGAGTSAVYYAPVNADGTIGSWVAGTSLPTTLSSFGLFVTSSRIYVVGGLTGVNNTVNTVYSAPFQGGLNSYMDMTSTTP